MCVDPDQFHPMVLERTTLELTSELVQAPEQSLTPVDALQPSGRFNDSFSRIAKFSYRQLAPHHALGPMFRVSPRLHRFIKSPGNDLGLNCLDKELLLCRRVDYNAAMVPLGPGQAFPTGCHLQRATQQQLWRAKEITVF